MRARIEDVARAAGVSMKTVSRVINNEPNVREATRQRILDAVAELGYRPDPSARSLAGSRSYLIALLYDNPSANYVMEILEGVLEACEAHHYNMMLSPLPYDSPDFLQRVDALLLHSKPDGLILTPPITENVALVEHLDARGIAHSSVSPKDVEHGVGVTLDERRAACDMVEYLASLGHLRIGHIKGHPAHGASEWRLAGYRDGLEQSGIPYRPELVVDGEFSFESGMAAARRLFTLPEPPTAVFAANDDMAAGVIRVAYERGLAVPGDVSVCGFDDSPMSRQIFPSLTTVRQPSRDMGRTAATELLRAIRERGASGMMRMHYALQLRQSTGRAPAASKAVATAARAVGKRVRS
jgi:LacI family transcriptional regulator